MGIEGRGFAIRVDQTWLRDDPGLPNDPDRDGVRGLAQGDLFDAKVYFVPEQAGEHEATLWLRTNDPRAERHEVALVATAVGAPPCEPLRPDPLDFGDVAVHLERRRAPEVANCSEAPLHVLAIETHGPFVVDPEQLGSLPLRVRAPTDTLDQPTRALPVFFAPDQLGPARGTLRVLTDDPEVPTRSIPLVGVGVRNQCPVARIEPARVTLAPGQPLRFSGEASSDPEGQGDLQWFWSLERPPGSGAALRKQLAEPVAWVAPDEDSATAVLAPDVLGRYVVQLDVRDVAGNLTSDCHPRARALVEVVEPLDGLSVSLTWESERPMTGRDGTDLDIHLRRIDSTWFDRLADVWSANAAPPFAIDAEEMGPVLGVTSNGGGPEVLHFPGPVAGEAYELAVHVFRQHTPEGTDLGASTATLRVHAGQRVVWTSEPRRLEAVNDFWVAARIVWPGAVVRVIDELFVEPP